MASRLVQTLKAVTQLGFSQNLNYLYYQCLLRIGYFRFHTPNKSQNDLLADSLFNPAAFNFWPEPDTKRLRKPSLQTIEQANEILTGKFQLFGMTEAPIDLSPRSILQHWSRGRIPKNGSELLDVKFIWEPARFSWAVKLAQAFYLTNDNKYVHFFWKKFTEFNEKNPLNLGPNWESAQEVALRLIALTISFNLMQDAKSLTKERKMILLRSIADHAHRIPPTLSYAKAQNNNHLISEAVGLYTAGIFLPQHPHAKKWERLGLKWFYHAIKNQITDSGEYIQHSNNYHRMMLMLALWMNALLLEKGLKMDPQAKGKLTFAVNWLVGQYDQISGRVPNLGHNDGSCILPFSSAAYDDYRPILSAANRAFVKEPTLEAGDWDDLSLWLSIPTQVQPNLFVPAAAARIGNKESWASVRAVQYTSRPAHADQLHVDLWYQGHNVTLDPGTFQYNASPPWDNGLAQTLVHNTITINEKDQMLRGGRFLWLDLAQAKIIERNENMICAEHYGYRKINAVHRRTLKKLTDIQWEVTDFIYAAKPLEESLEATLHWLLPDWPLKHKDNTFSLSAPFGLVNLQISTDPKFESEKFDLYHKGLATSGTEKKQPLLGWYSPTYGMKIPAYSILFSIEKRLPVTITSKFTFS